MPKYQFNNIRENPEFQEFVKSNWHRDVGSIQDYEIEAMFYQFKSRSNDMSPQDREFVNEIAASAQPQELDDLTSIYYPEKKYADLSEEDKSFVAVTNYEAKELNISLDDIKEFLRNQNSPEDLDSEKTAEDVYDAFHELADKYRYEPKQEDFDNFMKLKEEYLADKSPEERKIVEQQLERFLNNQDQEQMIYGNELYTVDDDFRNMFKEAEAKIQPAQQNTTNEQTPLEVSLDPADNTNQNTREDAPVQTNVPPTPPHDDHLQTNDNTPEPAPVQTAIPPREPENPKPQPVREEEEARIRSFNSDNNEALLDMVKVDALREMGVITDDDLNKLSKLPEEQVKNNINLLNDKLPKMSQQQLAEFEDKVTDRMLGNDELFALVPPAALAKAYTGLDAKIAQEQDNAKKQDLTAKKDKVGARMEQLTTMLAQNDHTFDDLYFADTTNIADVYEGYVKMYDAMDKNWRSPRDGGPLAQQIRQGEYKLREVYSQYREDYNLKNITANDADKLQKRYEDLNKQLSGVEIDENTAKLVSNFKFLDEQGNVEPQFVDKDGKQSDVYTDGAKVIEGSKLETSIRLAKQQILLENIGTETQFDDKTLQQQLAEQLPESLYGLHVADKVVQTGVEHPKQFTDKKFLNQFVADLANPNQPMAISHKGYEAGVDHAVNATAGYANALAASLSRPDLSADKEYTLANDSGRNKPVVMSVFNPIQNIDKRANDRAQNNVSKRAVRIEMLKRTAKGFASAFIVSAGITTLGTMAAADASLTASTMGLNKVAGMAIGSALAIGMTFKQIRSWRKQQKKEGKPAGFMAMLKDRKLAMTMATTAMGAAALGFAATGNPGVAQALGMGALAVGTANGVISNYGDSRKAGLGKFESVGWAALQAIGNAAGAYSGRLTANMAIDAWNKAHPNSELFQHKEVVGQKEVTDRVETQYKEGVSERAQQTVGKWYAGHEDQLQQRVAEINQYNAEHSTNIDPYRYLMAAHDAGAQTPDNMTLHNQGSPDVLSHGNHKVLGAGWSQETGISQQEVGNLANSVTTDGHVNISPESLRAFQQIDGHINMYNQVGYVDGAPYQNDGVLQSNASQNDAGRFVQDAKGDRFTTYADGDGVHQQHVITHKEDVIGMVRNESTLGYGMFGVMGNFLGAKKLKKRIGALLDRIKGKQPVKPITTPKKQYVAPQITVKDKIPDLMLDEYKIVYGAKPDENSKQYQNYAKRVEEERKAQAPDMSMNDFLLKRRADLDKVILDNIGDTHRTKIGSTVDNDKDGVKSRNDYLVKRSRDSRSTTAVVSDIRQSLMQSNLTSENYTDKITLSHFTKYAEHAVKHDSLAADGSRDVSLNPQLKGKYKNGNSDVKVTDLNAYLVEGKPLAQCQETVKGKDARQAMSDIRKQNQTSSLKKGGRE